MPVKRINAFRFLFQGLGPKSFKQVRGIEYTLGPDAGNADRKIADDTAAGTETVS